MNPLDKDHKMLKSTFSMLYFIGAIILIITFFYNFNFVPQWECSKFQQIKITSVDKTKNPYKINEITETKCISYTREKK